MSNNLEIFSKFLNQRVVIYLRNKFCYIGILLDTSEDFIILDDRKKGKIIISYNEINEIRGGNDAY